MTGALNRFSITEYEWSVDFVGRASRVLALERADVVELLMETNRRLSGFVRTGETILEVNGNDVRVRDCAGAVRFALGTELEIVPKFLTVNDLWREDFFLFATVAGEGTILPYEFLAAGLGEQTNLPTLIGKTMVGMFWKNYRLPLRRYVRRTWQEFVLRDEVDLESLFIPSDEGFTLSSTSLERSNIFNATIYTAFLTLLPQVIDNETSDQIRRVLANLAPQNLDSALKRHMWVPNRHRHWQPLFDLSTQVLRGFGVEYKGRDYEAPGFAFHTWRLWQEVVLFALQFGLTKYSVRGQPSFLLGYRNGRPLKVVPDVVISDHTGAKTLVVDAKYKTRVGNKNRIAEADVYECFAFMKGADASKTMLLYPRADSFDIKTPGTCSIFETIQIDDKQVLGATVECRGAAKSGFHAFAAGLSEFVEQQLKLA